MATNNLPALATEATCEVCMALRNGTIPPVSHWYYPHLQQYRMQPYQTHVPSFTANGVHSTAVLKEDSTMIAESWGCSSQYDKNKPTYINRLYPEILAKIFSYLELSDKGRAAQVCKVWCDAAAYKSVWLNVEAKLNMLDHLPFRVLESLKKRGIKRIQILSVPNCEMCLPSIVQNIPDLQSLNVSGCYNTKDIHLQSMFLEKYLTITELNLSLCNQITDNGVIHIANHLTGLTRFDIHGCKFITNVGFLQISRKLKKLKYLNARSCWGVSDIGLSHISGSSHLSNNGNVELEYLGLQDCKHITDQGLFCIAKGLESLRSLNLSFCQNITDTGVYYISQMKTLDELNLSSCSNISDTGTSFLFESCKKLGNLNLSFCENIGDRTFVHITRGLCGIHTLSLGCCRITDNGLKSISKTLKNLKVLNIGQCDSITDIGLDYLFDSCKLLSFIDLYGCTKVTKKAKVKILKLPNLTKDSINENLYQL